MPPYNMYIIYIYSKNSIIKVWSFRLFQVCFIFVLFPRHLELSFTYSPLLPPPYFRCKTSLTGGLLQMGEEMASVASWLKKKGRINRAAWSSQHDLRSTG